METSISTAAIGRVRKIRGSPAERSRERRRAVSIMGPRTRARTRGAAFIFEFLEQVADESENDHDQDFDDAVVQAVHADQAKKQDQGEKNRVRDFEDPDPEPDQRAG